MRGFVRQTNVCLATRNCYPAEVFQEGPKFKFTKQLCDRCSHMGARVGHFDRLMKTSCSDASGKSLDRLGAVCVTPKEITAGGTISNWTLL